MSGAYIQLGYVTNDFDRAIRTFQANHAIGPFKEMRDLCIGARAGKTVNAHFALAFKADAQFEIIAPFGGDADFYAEVLPPSGFAVRLHHIGRYFPDINEFHEALADAKTKWRVPVEVPAFGGVYAYIDARADFGHYLEMYSFPPEEHFDGVPRY